MSAILGAINQLSVPNHPLTLDCFPLHTVRPLYGQKILMTRCCSTKGNDIRSRLGKDYYQLLGVSLDSTSQEIKAAYRKLQKKYHPDVAGQKGHEHTLKLNEAYRVLMREDLKRDYDASTGTTRRSDAGIGYSSWRGPFRPQALFVDENACIGCRECVHNAGNTFVMDEELGCARVKVQYGDSEQKLEVSVDSCPVNCIHWVDREDLAVLEFLTRPQPKDGYGVFGGGWERPSDIFMAAKSFTKQMKRQNASTNGAAEAAVEEETPAQAKARMDASVKIGMERFSNFWDFIRGLNLNIWNEK